jgi:hypothetical protein
MLQEAVVRRYSYRLLAHTHKLYGLCQTCQHLTPQRVSGEPHLPDGETEL